MHDGKFSPTVKIKFNVTGVRNLSNMAPRKIDDLRQGMEVNGGVHIISPWDLFWAEPEFLISSQRLGHVTPKAIWPN